MGEPPAATTHADAAAATVHAQMRAGAVAAPEQVELAAAISMLPKLRFREPVREARRITWFVVNETGDELATIPIELGEPRSISRVQVNGEVAEFSATRELVLVRPRRTLRAGAGTIVVIHFR